MQPHRGTLPISASSSDHLSLLGSPAGFVSLHPDHGGTIQGSPPGGKVLSAGADYKLIRADGYTTLDARYVICLDDGALIYVGNTDVRFEPQAVMARVAAGQIVDPAKVYFRTTPASRPPLPNIDGWHGHCSSRPAPAVLPMSRLRCSGSARSGCAAIAWQSSLDHDRFRLTHRSWSNSLFQTAIHA